MTQHDLIVIGGGPGGYVAAIRAGQLGLDVACIDEHAQLGGTCLRVGCIPSKAMLESSERYAEAQHDLRTHGINIAGIELDLTAMLKRKQQIVGALSQGVEALLKKNKVTHYRGRARLDGPQRVVVEGDQTEELTAKSIIIATGSMAATLPGVELEGDRIGANAEALAYEHVPQHLIVIGAGYIGLELGSVWRRLGAKVTVLEYLDRILPGIDAQVADEAEKLFKRQGLDIRTGTAVTGARVEGDECVVECASADPVRGDRVLVAVGRKPNTEGLGLESVGIELDRTGHIPIDEGFATSADGVYAVGDVVRGPALAHKAEEEGMACAEQLAGETGQVNYDAIPAVVYTQPEIAAVGRTEEQLTEAGVDYRKGVFQFRANGRARTLGHTHGFVKMLADRQSDQLLGVHILGPRAGDMIAEAALAMSFGGTAEDIALTCHAHPTLSEAVKEAALAVDERAIHS